MSSNPVAKRIDEILGMNEFPLPRGPALALIRLTQREFVSLAVVAHAIKADPTFAVRVIKVADSVGGPDHAPVVSLRDAVDVLGVAPVRSLAMGFSLLEHHRGAECAGFNGARFWSRSLARALALQLLAAGRGDVPKADAFSVGLLARVGELVLATLFPQAFSALLERRGGAREDNPSKAEEEITGAGAASISAAILLEYHLPEVYAEAVESLGGAHVLDIPASASNPVARQLLELADHIGEICVAPESDWAGQMPTLFERGADLSLDSQAVIALCERAAHEWRAWGAELGLETGPIPRFEQADLMGDTPLPDSAAPNTVAPARVAAAPSAVMSAAPVAPSAALRILLVGDEAKVRRPLRAVLAAAGHEVTEAGNGRDGLASSVERKPQVLLVDVESPEIGGTELIRTLRQFKTGRDIYALVLGNPADEQLLAEAFEAGADGVVPLLPSPRVLAGRLLAAQRAVGLHEELRRDQEELRRISAELSATNQKLQEAGMTDMLTGCPNRRYAVDRLNQEWAMAVRTDRPLACMVIELDNLKAVNESHGQQAGDSALKLIASAFKGEMRAQEVLARIGGSEFMVICPDTSLDAALACGERMRAAAAAQPLVAGASPMHGSVSIGVAAREAGMADPEALLRMADQSAYLARRNRNSVAAMQRSAASPGH